LGAANGGDPADSESSPYLDEQYPDSFGGDMLSIALIGPDEERRTAASNALSGCQTGGVHEFSSYPPTLDDVPRLLEQNYNVIIIDLDSNSEYALELVESICATGSATVMVYSVKADSELLVRCMRAGAREFLTLPFAQNTMAEALIRASARRPASRSPKKAGGRLLVFLGAKGGDGVTTLACNFAVSLAQEAGQSTLLLDLDLPLGDAALNLGITAEYSTINALQNSSRLDSSFLSKLLVKHSSGVSVLGAPGKFPQYQASNESIDRLITVARQDFDNVVVDMGSRLDLMGTSLFKEGATVYLVIQAGIAGLRNSNRLISQYFATDVPKLEIVLNRYEPRVLGVSEEQITKALTRPAQWKIPNDYGAVQRMQHTAVPLALEDSPISRLIRQMARAVCGLPAMPEKKAGFSLKSFSRGFSSKITPVGESRALTQLGLIPSTDSAGLQPEIEEKAQSKPYYIPSAVSSPASGERTAPTPIDRADRADRREAERVEPQRAGGSSKHSEPETRSYKGSTYVKGPDGEWHIKNTESASAAPLQASIPSRPVTSASPQVGPETRSYKGSTYVKGPDGEWHLQGVPVVIEKQVTPSITWTAPAPIAYGTALGATELNATASVAGKLEYSPAAGEILSAGKHTLSVTFTPEQATESSPVQASTELTVTKATPVTNWPTPAPIVYGVEISSAQLNATASVPGRFDYTPAEGKVLSAGAHTLTATFTPTDTTNYTTAQAAVSFMVAKAKPAVTWATPAPIIYGTGLGSSQLNAKASIPGSFAYAPAADAVLATGVQKLTVTFSPTDSTNYTTAQCEVALAITKATPALTWPAPAAIVYGTALGSSQLNATSPVAGKFAYVPTAGAVLSAGTHTPSVTFIPTDAANYTMAQAAVTLTVNKATPSVTWPAPAPIVYGTALSANELNATSPVPGRFTYTPEMGKVLSAGTHTLAVTFTPIDTTDYAVVHLSAQLTVTKAEQITITWPAPAAIPHGAALSAAELNAAAPVPGSFVYSPAAGEVLATGTHKLSVTFTPTDANLPVAHATVSLTVTKATPIIDWQTPASISYGTALGAAQLNASTSIPGTFSYTPAAGEVLGAGTHTLSVVFTPKDSVNNAIAQTTVKLTVAKATPIVTWSTPEPIAYGTALSATQLNAVALIPGTFVYTPAAGTVIASGTQTLSATFMPTDTANYSMAQAAVQLVVEGLPNIASLMPASGHVNVERADFETARQGTPQGESAFNRQSKLETRTYKGATYVKGADGQWYLQKS
jgi:Flp pilus assembly CpaE family ATPase